MQLHAIPPQQTILKCWSVQMGILLKSGMDALTKEVFAFDVPKEISHAITWPQTVSSLAALKIVQIMADRRCVKI